MIKFNLSGEFEHTISIAKPKFAFVSKAANSALPLLKKQSHVKIIILMDDESTENGKLISFSRFIEKYSQNDFDVEQFVRKPVELFSQVAAIFMSSGTTGLPKGKK